MHGCSFTFAFKSAFNLPAGHVQKYGGSFDQNSKTLKMAKNRFFAIFSSIFKKSTPNFKQSFSPLILIYYHIEKIKKCLHNTFMIKN